MCWEIAAIPVGRDIIETGYNTIITIQRRIIEKKGRDERSFHAKNKKCASDPGFYARCCKEKETKRKFHEEK